MTDQPALVPVAREMMDTFLCAVKFAQHVITVARNGEHMEPSEVLAHAQDFGLQTKRPITDEERSDPVRLLELLGIDGGSLRVVEFSAGFADVLGSFTPDEDEPQEAAE